METLTTKDANYGFGRLIDLARAETVAVAENGRPIVVVMAVEEFERLKWWTFPRRHPSERRGFGYGDKKIRPLFLPLGLLR